MEEEYTTDQSSQYANRFIQYINELKELCNKYSAFPPGKGFTEKEYLTADEKHRKGLINSYDLGGLLLIVSFDHIFSFLRTINEPTLTVAPWANARSVIESSGISSWFTNIKIDPVERITRVYSYRYNGINEQIKIFRVMNDPISINDTNEIGNKLVREAIELGINPVRDKKHKVDGIGFRMPSITRIIRDELNQEAVYRILSSQIHGYSWSLTQMSFTRITTGERPMIEKKLHPNSIIYLCHLLSDSIIVPIRNKSILFGWDISISKDIYLSAREDYKKITNSVV
jgi:hypothetical protein